MGLRVSLFGPIRVSLGDAPMPSVRSRKAFSLLALLILRNGRHAARGWVATTLWPDADLTTALSSLRPVVSELRRALGPESDRLKSRDRNSIAFDVDGLSIDALEFDKAIKAHDFATAVERYTGPLLEGSEEEWVFQERRTRQETFLAVLMGLGERSLEKGEPQNACGYFRRAISVDPHRDLPRRGMIQAYAASGDLNAALGEYREYAHLLSGEFGTRPEAETTALYDQLRQEIRTPAKPVSRAEKPQSKVGHIPTPLTALIGRDDERLDVSGVLRRSRLVTLTGAGGIGKTRLALAVASDNAKHFPDGVWFVPLEELIDGDLIARQIGDVLGLKEIPGKTCLRSLADHLQDKRALLVLDNCEHLRESCAKDVLRLLSECPSLRILTTSRQSLGIVGEISWTVPALAVPIPEQLPEGRATALRVAMGYEGVRLFVERAEAVAPGFSLTAANTRTISDICHRLEGIPLALELAAARIKAVTVEEVFDRLRVRLDLLPTTRVAPSRQQTLRSTLEWSHELLTEDGRVVLRQLSVLIGGWTIDAAAYLCADEMSRDHVSDVVSLLVDHSLLTLDILTGRYRWSEIVRQFAEEKLRAAGELETFSRKRLDWCVEFAEGVEPKLTGPRQLEALRRLEVEMPNLRAAIDWAITNEEAYDLGLRLTGALSRYWYTRGELTEGRARLTAALAVSEGKGRTSGRAKALYGLGILAYSQCDFDEARASHEESLSIRRELGDRRGMAESLLNVGNVAHATSDHATAEAHFERALEMNTEIEDRHGAALASSNLGAVKFALGQNRAARAQLERSVEMWRQIGNHGYMAWDLSNLAYIFTERGDYLEAQVYLNECWTIFEELGNRSGLAWTLYKLAKVEVDEGRYDSGRDLLEKSLAIFEEMGDRNGIAWCIEEKSLASRGSGDLTSARSLLDQATNIFREIKDRQAVAYMTQRLGVLHRFEGDIERAIACNDDALAAFMLAGERRGIMRVLQEQAMIAIRQGHYEMGAATWGAAEAIREEHDLFIPSSEKDLFEPSLSMAQATLGDLAFDSAVEKGSSMCFEDLTHFVIGK